MALSIDALARRLAREDTASRRDFLTGRHGAAPAGASAGAITGALFLTGAEASVAEGVEGETAARRPSDPRLRRLRRVVEEYDDEMRRRTLAFLDALVPRPDGTADAKAVRALASVRGTVRRARKRVAELEGPRTARAQVLESLALTERSFDHFARVLQMTDENAREAPMNRAVELLKEGRQKGGVAARALGCGKRDCLVLR